MGRLVEVVSPDLAETWRRCGGYYLCPKCPDGKRLGPLVGYAGTYDDNGTPKHFVGDAYFNFAKVEEYPNALGAFSAYLRDAIKHRMDLERLDWILGAPMGGICLASRLAESIGCRFLFAEKKVTRVAEGYQREKSMLVMARHEIPTGSRGAIAEDVCNNYSTTEELLQLARNNGASAVLAIVCAMNRSDVVRYTSRYGDDYPVISAIHQPTPQYCQDDPAVAEDIASGNVVWKPKAEWNRLMEAMGA